MAEKRVLTEQQQKFLNVLFGEANGDLAKAALLAGYHPDYHYSRVAESVKDEIIERTKTFIARTAPKAAYSIYGALENPTELGLKEKLNAAKDLLDRVGLVKTEKVQVEASGGIMVLPPKDKAVNEDDE